METARVDEKGRLKLPANFLRYLKSTGVEIVFITTLDLRVARVYPISVWESNEKVFETAGGDAETAEDVALIADEMGAESEIDAQGRILLPAILRRQLEIEAAPVWLHYYNGGITVFGEKVYEQRKSRAVENLGAKVKTLATKGLK